MTGRRPSSLFLLAFVTLAFLLGAGTARAAISPQQREALIALYNSTNGDSWTHSENWKAAPLAADGFGPIGTENTWYGVLCNESNTNVVSLRLYGNNLTGTIPSQIQNLTELVQIDLSYNNLTGPLPVELGSLDVLEKLFLDNNPLNQTLPTLSLVSLKALHLNSCQLQGTIPSWIGNRTTLTDLRLSNNSFTGAFPDLSLLNRLQILDLGDLPNLDAGPIPSWIGSLTSLLQLYMVNTHRNGALPTSMGALTSLQTLDLRFNSLTGSIPDAWSGMSQMKFLELSYNPLDAGPIPTWLPSTIQSLNLTSTNRTGTVPASVQQCPGLAYILLGGNQLTGAFPQFVSTSLIIVELTGNKFDPGPIPSWLNGLTPQYVLIGGTNRMGSIPSWLKASYSLDLSRNYLSGSIPSGIGDCTTLTSLNLSRNNLQGEIPATFSQLTHLRNGELDLSYNGLYTTDSTLRSRLNSVHVGGDMDSTQTVLPANAQFSMQGNRLHCEWTAIPYTDDNGGYRFIFTPHNNPLNSGNVLFLQGKSYYNMTSYALPPGKSFQVKLQTVTFPHAQNSNSAESVLGPLQTFSTPGMPGDFNSDNVRNAADATMLADYLAGNSTPPEGSHSLDEDMDGRTMIFDLVWWLYGY